MEKTKQILSEMLKENTGVHMLDSGGAYGRHWERNKDLDFESQPKSTVDFSYNEISASHNVYHWLAERLEYDPVIDAAFQAYCRENSDDSTFYLMEPFANKMGGKGIYGDGYPMIVNTYNGEDMLSQTLQYCYFEIDGSAYVLLQIHGGCDVRGGYTDPRAFRVSEECAMFDNARATIYCEKCQATWSTDDTCHWYYDGTNAATELQEYDFTDVPGERGNGKIFVEDASGFCPKCGGRLLI
jgi:hypothetical protein